jgi:spore coat polysaccharide biosynthesis predicted glycosyltransferase SpsG
LIKDKYSKEFFEIYNQLNDLLFDIYDFEEDDRRLINEILKEGMSKKQNG